MVQTWRHKGLKELLHGGGGIDDGPTANEGTWPIRGASCGRFECRAHGYHSFSGRRLPEAEDTS